MEEKKIKFKFYMTDELDNEFSFEETVNNYSDSEELDFILNEFKHFLLASGYPEACVSRIQYLEDNEWKYVLEQYGEWNPYYEKLYNEWKRFN